MYGWKKAAIIGGIWGLVTGIMYTIGVYYAAVSGSRDVGTILKNIPLTWKIIYLPAYLTDTLGGILGKNVFIFGILGLIPFIIIWCIGLPVLFGTVIGLTSYKIKAVWKEKYFNKNTNENKIIKK